MILNRPPVFLPKTRQHRVENDQVVSKCSLCVMAVCFRHWPDAYDFFFSNGSTANQRRVSARHT
jgi:hypothetical protein